MPPQQLWTPRQRLRPDAYSYPVIDWQEPQLALGGMSRIKYSKKGADESATCRSGEQDVNYASEHASC